MVEDSVSSGSMIAFNMQPTVPNCRVGVAPRLSMTQTLVLKAKRPFSMQ